MCISTVNDAMCLVKSLLSELNGVEFQVHIIKLSISVLLYALSKMETLVEQNTMNENEVTRVFGMCQVALLDWVKRRSVIGGSYFGYNAQNKMTLLYGSVELVVRMLSCHCLCQ